MNERIYTTPEEAVRISAHLPMSETLLAINSALMIAPNALNAIDGSTLADVFSAVYTAGKINGIREERTRHK